MNFLLRIWRQPNAKSRGKLVDYQVRDISPNTSFLEMLDILNETLVTGGTEPIAFDSDSQTRRRFSNGSSCLHRMRRMRGGLSKWIGHAFHCRKGLTSIVPAAGSSGTR